VARGGWLDADPATAPALVGRLVEVVGVELFEDGPGGGDDSLSGGARILSGSPAAQSRAAPVVPCHERQKRLRRSMLGTADALATAFGVF